jgi:large subunit ribosomal protein L2
MGKRIIQQRRGRGSSTYRAPPYKFRPSLSYKDQPGRVVDIVRDSMRNSPLAEIEYMDRSRGYIIAPESVRVGDPVENIVIPLSRVTEGMQISAIEMSPNSGPKLCRTPGSFATMVSRGKKECIIQLPSKKKKRLNPGCRAIVGVPAGEGRRERPFVKAGKKWIAMRARGKLYPRTSGGAMNVVDHPFGGGYTGLGKPKSVSRHAPPGKKVGSISPRRTGKRK